MAKVKGYASHFINRMDVGLIIAALLTLLIIQSLWQPGLPAAADMPIHLYRTLEYKQAWAPGVLVPRWAPNLAFGYGYPLFVFTPPLPHLLALVFYGAGFTLETALKILIILTILLYATGMYLLARDVLGSLEAGLVAAVAYAFAPFALREALLYGGNVPQFLAIGLFPWTLWAMTRSARTYFWGWLILAAIFYAGVMLSHLYQVLVFTPVVGLYGLMLFWLSVRTPSGASQASKVSHFSFLNSHFSAKPYRLIVGLLPLVSIPLGLLLSAFFWLPAFTERFYTRAQANIYLEKSPFYVRYPHWSELVAWIYPLDARAANPYVPLTLGVVTLILALFGLLTGLWLLIKKRAIAPGASPVCFILFFALVAAAGIFLTLPLSRPVWETLTILQVAEFPWRLLSLANLGLAFLAGAALLLLPSQVRRLGVAVCVAIQIVAVAPLLYPVIPFAQYGQPTLADQVDYERRSQSVGTTTVSEYLPQTVSQAPTTSPLLEAFLAGQNPRRLDYASLPAGTKAILLKQNAITHIYRLNGPKDFTLRFFHFYYPGWQAWINDRPVNITPEPGTGLMLIDLPAGQHTLTVRFGETPVRVTAMLWSGLAMVSLLVAGLSWQVSRRRRVEKQDKKARSPAPRQKILIILLAMALAVIGAFWLKPLLRSVFTIQSPPGQALPAGHKADIRFADGLRLIGYDLDKPIVSPGGRLQVVLYWATDTAPIKANLQPFVHLDRLNDWTTVADATNYTPGDATTESVLPTFHWDTARYVRDEHDLILPPDLPPLAYAVRVGLIDPDRDRLLPLADGSGDTAQLTIIRVKPAPGQITPLAEQLDVIFSNDSDTIYLTGFQLEAQTETRLDFTLAWQSDQTPQKDYTVFAQLFDLDQNLVAGFDRPPLDGAYPTSTWLPDQTILDPRSIPLNEVAPGEYLLVVGLYDPLTLARLTTTGGLDFVELTTVTVGER
ncbi:MAG: hypothetical protein JW953_12495 [Anaerolineae bacterium]|nr:hypothetical protein [Anaerolineae bacterium]